MTALDVGASTGGFTDCLLQEGAGKVYALDVGYGQLAWKLRTDPRVVIFERTNIRYFDGACLEDDITLATIDVSFISLTLVLPVVVQLIEKGGVILALIKPQFEAGKNKVGKHGVVSEQLTHVEVIDRVLDVARTAGFCVRGLSYSPIRGPKGNIEFLVFLEKCIQDDHSVTEIDHNIAVSVVQDAHNSCI